MAWCLFAIATRPEVEARIVKELDSLGLLASPQNPNPRDLTLDDLPKLVYLNAVIKESMRYHTVSSRTNVLPAGGSKFCCPCVCCCCVVSLSIFFSFFSFFSLLV